MKNEITMNERIALYQDKIDAMCRRHLKHGSYMDYNELYSVALEASWKGLIAYDKRPPAHIGTSENKFVQNKINWAIAEALRNSHHVMSVKGAARDAVSINKILRDNPAATNNEVVEAMRKDPTARSNITASTVSRLRSAHAAERGFDALDHRGDDSDGSNYETSELASREESAESISEHISLLNFCWKHTDKRTWRLIKVFYTKNCDRPLTSETPEQLAKHMGKSLEACRLLAYKKMERLKKRLRENYDLNGEWTV